MYARLLLSAVAVCACFCSLKSDAADLMMEQTVPNGDYSSDYQFYFGTSPVSQSTALSSCQDLDSSGRTWWLGTVKSAAALAWVKSTAVYTEQLIWEYPNVWLSGSRTQISASVWTNYSWTTGRNSGVSFSSGSSLLSGYTGLNWDPAPAKARRTHCQRPTDSTV